MSLKLVTEFPCDECGVELTKDTDRGYEENQHLCQECYNKAIDAYEGELIETQSYQKAYVVLLQKYANLQAQLARKHKKLLDRTKKLQELEQCLQDTAAG